MRVSSIARATAPPVPGISTYTTTRMRFAATPPTDEAVRPRLQTVVDQLVKKYGYPGAYIYLDGPPQAGYDGTPLVVKAGSDTVGTTTPIADDPLILSASITKSLVAGVALQLAEEGKLNLWDNLEQCLPAKDIARFEAQRAEPLISLLRHASGLPDWLNTAFLTHATQLGWTDEAARQLTKPLDHDAILDFTRQADHGPRTRGSFNYCNTNYELLARVIEEVEGQPLGQVLQKRLFTPLGLTHTHFETWPDTTTWANGYSTYFSSTLPQHPNMHWNIPVLWGRASGGVVSTPQEIAALYRGLYGQAKASKASKTGRRSLLLRTPESHERLINSVIPTESNNGTQSSLGVFRRKGKPGFFHNGSPMGYKTLAYYNEETDMAVVAFVNSDQNRHDLLGSQLAGLFREVGFSV
ncbi:MAG: beta-lactamase family protein [Cyanobacteria bacterium HKST-UBA03]|nr:beta-lactamase family protein [Cyanobacteria bacterium HKST-UBA03]